MKNKITLKDIENMPRPLNGKIVRLRQSLCKHENWQVNHYNPYMEECTYCFKERKINIK